MTESAGDLEAAHPELPRPRVRVPASFLPTVVDEVDPTHADSEEHHVGIDRGGQPIFDFPSVFGGSP